MDPNQTLRAARDANRALFHALEADNPEAITAAARELGLNFNSLDSFLRTGGTLPDRWAR